MRIAATKETLTNPENLGESERSRRILGLQLEQQWDVGLPSGPMTLGFGIGSFVFDEKPQQRRVKEWSPIDRMLAEKGSRRRSKTELPPLSPPPATTTAKVQTESWEVLLKEAVVAALVPEQQKHKALQAEIVAMQRQLKEKDEEIKRCVAQIESCNQSASEANRTASEAKRNASEAERARAAERFQYFEEKRSMDEFKKSVEKQKCQPQSMASKIARHLKMLQRKISSVLLGWESSWLRLQWTQERETLEAPIGTCMFFRLGTSQS
eukprot:Skav235249  [mRNA]  locus=scaffold3995:344075:348098:+ [translate_table: standard]